MKILKKAVIIILTAIIIIFSLIPPKIVNAQTSSEEVGQAIADTTIDFYNRFASQTIYDYPTAHNIGEMYVDQNFTRVKAYQNIMMGSGTARSYSGKETTFNEPRYTMDCVGFVSMIVHRATPLGNDYFSIFAVPTLFADETDYTNFERYNANQIKPGDLLVWEDHVGIAINGTEMIDSAGAGKNGSISRRNISNYGKSLQYVLRVKEDVASALINEGLNHEWYPDTEIEVWYDNGTPWGYTQAYNPDLYNESIKFEHNGEYTGIGNSLNFYYNGLPISGAYQGHSTILDWIIEGLENVLDWLAGIMTLGVKIQIVGWTAMFQNMATDIVESITNIAENQQITAERILFNKIQILDINFFNRETAGGQEFEDDGIIDMIKQNIAGFYYVVRNISIMVMLVILIYVGIRMALSTIAGEKAKYRKMFFSWCVGFIVIMCIHYFMLVVINVNEQVINFMAPTDENGTIIYDTAREYAYEIPATKGWTGTILYVFLVYYMVKLLLFYFKRLLIVYILAIIAPILGIKYAVEALKGKSKSLSVWMKEFAFNVIIQSIHVITYCVFMKIIYENIKGLSIFNLLSYSVLMILVLNLMLRIEKLIKKIFGLKSNTMKEIIDTVLGISGTLITARAITRPIYSLGKAQVLKQYNKGIDNHINNKYKQFELPADKVNSSEVAKQIQEEINRLKEEEKARIKKYDSNAVAYAKSMLNGAIGMVGTVPTLFEMGPATGAVSILNVHDSMYKPLGSTDPLDIDENRIDELLVKYGKTPIRKPATTAQTTTVNTISRTIRTYNTSKNKKYEPSQKFKRMVASSITAGTTTRLMNMYNTAKEEKDKINNPYQTARIVLLFELQKQAIEYEEKLNSSIKELKKTGFYETYITEEGDNPVKAAKNKYLNKIHEQKREELEINLRQAMEGEPSVDKETVKENVLLYNINNGHKPSNIEEVKEVVDEIAKTSDYEVGDKLEENIVDTITKDLMNLAEKKEKERKLEEYRKKIVNKIEVALNNNNWDEERAEREIRNIVSNNVANDVIEKLSANELVNIMSEAINRHGSIENKVVKPEYEEVVKNAAKLVEINKDIDELSGREKYDTEELIKNILDTKNDILD